MKKFWLLFFLAGCTLRPWLRPPGDPAQGVTITWWGHSAFSFSDSAQRVWLVDAYDETVADAPPWPRPTALLITHDHFDHDFRPAGRYEVVDTTGVHTVDGIEVTVFPSFHDGVEGRRHGPNRILFWSMGGVSLAHLGDIGSPQLSTATLQALEGVDVLFVPVGGQTTVDAAGAEALVRQIHPRVVVPMHYGHPRVRFFPFDPVEPFLSRFLQVQHRSGSAWTVVHSALDAGPTVEVFEWPKL